MQSKTKRYIALFIILNVFVYLYFSFSKRPSESAPLQKREAPDISEILQYGDKVENVKLTDKYGNVFDMDAYRDQPLLLLFMKSDFEHLQKYDTELRISLKDFFDKGLKPIYINSTFEIPKEQIENYKGAIKIFQDTDDFLFFNKFKSRKCCGSSILLDRKHIVLLSTISSLRPQQIKDIVEYKEDSIFN